MHKGHRRVVKAAVRAAAWAEAVKAAVRGETVREVEVKTMAMPMDAVVTCVNCRLEAATRRSRTHTPRHETRQI